MIKKIIIFASIAALALASCGKDGGDSALVDGNGNPVSTAESTAEGGTENTENTSAPENGASENSASETAEQEKVTPTFMFFYSAGDADLDGTLAAVEELKETYGDKVKFDLINIDENAEAKENFPVDGQTPALIMLNTSNDISAFEFKINDKAKMEEDIKAALGE